MIITEDNIKKIEKMANNMRENALKMANSAGNKAAHVGPGLSIIDILAVLYGEIMDFNQDNKLSQHRDRFILSKEHGVLAYYSALKEIGILDEHDMASFMKTGSDLLGHPVMNRNKGIEFTSGSLGMGLSLAIGVAIALKRKEINKKIYVLVGDGECNEGSIWEGIMSAAQLKLNNLVLIIDRNGLQLGAKTEDTLDLGDLSEKLACFGWSVDDVDGHNIESLLKVFSKQDESEKPRAIIAKTVKGKSVSFMEHNIDWHHAVLTDKLFKEAMEEQVKS